MTMDVSDTIVAKSDQLNADDLLGGPITVQVQRVTRAQGDQPIIVHISGGHRPWKPCKTARRCLVAGWGKQASEWVGRRLTLWRDPDVTWAGERVGGIRISHMSDIARPMELSLTETRGKKQLTRIGVIEDVVPVELDALLADAGLELEDVDRWRESIGKGPISELTDEQRAVFAAWLAANQAKLEDIRGMIPLEDES